MTDFYLYIVLHIEYIINSLIQITRDVLVQGWANFFLKRRGRIIMPKF